MQENVELIGDEKKSVLFKSKLMQFGAFADILYGQM